MSENENLQYNSCISKGICSVNPRTSALQNVLGLYLNLCAKYCIKLYKKNALKNSIKEFILNTVAISVSNPEFTENCFMEAIKSLKKILPEIISTYNNLYGTEDFKGENILSSDLFKNCEDIVEAIKFGEYLFKTQLSKIEPQIRNLFNIILIVSKSISINLLDFESYIDTPDYESEEICDAFEILLNLLDSININNNDTDKLKELIYEGADCNTKLMRLLHQEQEKRYGTQEFAEISYTTTPSKAVLVVGSNIRELETILENLKGTNIDVYTHDEMMVAHTFPYFKKYQNLKGQYGYGVENCLLDFATFPGPIILTKHSLHNIENLYRGRLFTTDSNAYKGVVRIKDNDYSEIIKSANDAKGFKKGKICETVTTGYDYEKSVELIREKLGSGKYKKVVVIGLKEFSTEQKDYFKSLVKHLSQEVLIISFSHNFEKDNFLYFNTCFDSFAVVRIVSYLLDFELPLYIFLPKCGRNTIPEMIHYAKYKQSSVYMGECEPIMINPAMKISLKNVFGLKTISLPKKDAEEINKLPNS